MAKRRRRRRRRKKKKEEERRRKKKRSFVRSLEGRKEGSKERKEKNGFVESSRAQNGKGFGKISQLLRERRSVSLFLSKKSKQLFFIMPHTRNK